MLWVLNDDGLAIPLLRDRLDTEVLHVEEAAFVDDDVGLTVAEEGDLEGLVLDANDVLSVGVGYGRDVLGEVEGEVCVVGREVWRRLDGPHGGLVVALPEPCDLVHDDSSYAILLEAELEREVDVGEEGVGDAGAEGAAAEGRAVERVGRSPRGAMLGCSVGKSSVAGAEARLLARLEVAALDGACRRDEDERKESHTGQEDGVGEWSNSHLARPQ